MSDPIVFDRFNPPGDEGVDCSCDDKITQDEFKDEVDINRIMGRVLGGGQIETTERVGSYGDYSEVPDFQGALEIIRRSEAQFAGLPSRVRERFGNDPARFLEWVHDPETKLEEANELGLLGEEAVKRLEAAAAAAIAARTPAGPAEQPVVVAPGTVQVSTLKTV